MGKNWVLLIGEITASEFVSQLPEDIFLFPISNFNHLPSVDSNLVDWTVCESSNHPVLRFSFIKYLLGLGTLSVSFQPENVYNV